MNGYKKEDPNTRNQCALPLNVFKLLYFNRISTKNKHIGLLATGALFYGMRSCEYLKVRNAHQKQTRLLRIENFKFFIKNRRLDNQKDNLMRADFLAITFVSQKNGEKFQSIIQHKSNRTLCPIKAWGELINTILSYENTNEHTEINYFISNNGPAFISAEDLIIQLRAACKTIGTQKLGFTPDRVGTHSIRTSFSMQLHLAGVKDHIIMLQGRWKSLSFLQYIRLQVQELSKDLSQKMVSAAVSHFNISEDQRNISLVETSHINTHRF